MMRSATLAILLAAISGCGMSKGQSANDQAAEMIEWMQRNPPVSQATWRGIAKLECRPQFLDVCGGRSCKSKQFDAGGNQAPVLLRWLPAEQTFQRCDPDGASCDTYNPVVSYSGSFANIVAPENAMMFRLTASGEYREVVSLGNDTYVYRGQCSKVDKNR